MGRALRRHRQRTFLAKHRKRVRRWARRTGGWTMTEVEERARREAATHGTCCRKHQAWPFRLRYARPAPVTSPPE